MTNSKSLLLWQDVSVCRDGGEGGSCCRFHLERLFKVQCRRMEAGWDPDCLMEGRTDGGTDWVRWGNSPMGLAMVCLSQPPNYGLNERGRNEIILGPIEMWHDQETISHPPLLKKLQTIIHATSNILALSRASHVRKLPWALLAVTPRNGLWRK